MSERKRKRFPFDFRISISGVIGAKPFSISITPEGIITEKIAFMKREPVTDVIEKEKEIIVIAELPGAKKERIEVYATEDKVTISASNKNREYFKKISLPSRIDPKKSKASYRNGLLTVRLKKIEKVGERVEIE